MTLLRKTFFSVPQNKFTVLQSSPRAASLFQEHHVLIESQIKRPADRDYSIIQVLGHSNTISARNKILKSNKCLRQSNVSSKSKQRGKGSYPPVLCTQIIESAGTWGKTEQGVKGALEAVHCPLWKNKWRKIQHSLLSTTIVAIILTIAISLKHLHTVCGTMYRQQS